MINTFNMNTGSKSGSGVADQEQETRGLRHWTEWSTDMIRRLEAEKAKQAEKGGK